MTDCDHNHAAARNGKRLIAALIVITAFMVVEVIGGILSGSLALLADAVHMLTDALALALAVSAHWIARRPADGKLHFGYRRAQVLAAFVNGVALTILIVWIAIEAMQRAVSPVDVAWRPMIVIAVLGLGANLVAYKLLHGGAKSDINVRGAMLHVISDLLGSVAAIIAAVVIALTGWMQIDPILSVLVAILIARSAFKLLRETGHILLEGAPADIDVAKLTADLIESSPDIEDVHQIKIWQITPDQPRITLHARLKADASGEATMTLIKGWLAERYGIEDSTVQIEISDTCPDMRARARAHQQAPRNEPAAQVSGQPITGVSH
ncbi:MAG: cation diffusion facilitator family transporter [Parvularculaceae bacterium]